MVTLADIAALRRRTLNTTHPNFTGIGIKPIDTTAPNFAGIGNKLAPTPSTAPTYGTNEPPPVPVSGNPFGPGPVNNPTVIGASGVANYIPPALPATPPSLPVMAAPSALAPPLAIDTGVNQAYQALMAAQAQGDQDVGNFRRQLGTNLDLAGKNRVKGILTSHQNMADRGMLNSGIALGQEGDINTNYDTLNQSLLDQYGTNVDAISRNILGLQTGYHNAQDIASGNYTATQAKAAADAILAQQNAAAQQQQVADLLATLAPAAPVSAAPVVKAKPAPKPKPAAKPASSQPKQVVHGGPQ